VLKICQNIKCGKTFKVAGKGSAHNNHRKYCYRCDAQEIWGIKNKCHWLFLRKRWARLNPERANARHRRHRLKKKYGLTDATFNNILAKQNNRCAICNKVFSDSRKPNVDHKHQKRKNHRGLLCASCNFVVGHCYEDTNILRRAIGYLDKWKIKSADIGG
jgi:hypothetical protein